MNEVVLFFLDFFLSWKAKNYIFLIFVSFFGPVIYINLFRST